ncbi:MAG: OmpA family protein [Burkholderiales bacterium]
MYRTLLIATLTALVSSTAPAQTALHYREGQRVDPHEVERILGGSDEAPIKTRSIRLLLAESAAQRPDADLAPAAPAPRAVSLPVRFEFDSAEVSASARVQLDALAEGIKLLPPDRSVRVEGHTDAVGSADYNLRLSLRRAAAVKRYLVQVHGIDASRLKEAGLGVQQPIDGLDPFAAQNRRVQFSGA